MMRGNRPPATRSNVIRYTRRLDQVRRGATLLKRKRQFLVEELFARARTAIVSRESIEAQARRAWPALWRALASQGRDGLTPLGWPVRGVDVELTTVELWGIRAAQLTKRPPLVRSLAARGMVPGIGETSTHEAARDFERLVEQLLDAAPQEHALRQLGQAVAQTTRLVNTLEQRVATKLAAELRGMQRTLSEREREEHLRIKRLIARRRSRA